MNSSGHPLFERSAVKLISCGELARSKGNYYRGDYGEDSVGQCPEVSKGSEVPRGERMVNGRNRRTNMRALCDPTREVVRENGEIRSDGAGVESCDFNEAISLPNYY